MSKIENIKTYEGNCLDNIFFRPMLTGKSAEELGIKVMYNVPVPTTLHFWRRNGDILKSFTSSGWSGGEPSTKYQKTLDLKKVKAEMAYSAEDYFSTVYELITSRSDVNLEDLSGTELEEAETALFRDSIAESIRATMWYGDTSRSNGRLATFDGFIPSIVADCDSNDIAAFGFIPGATEDWAERVLKNLWDKSSEKLHTLRSEGQLAFFVSSDVYNAYEESLDNVAIEAAYLAKQTGREALYYRGIPVVDVQMNGYNTECFDLPHTFAILTDRRNLALAVNTSDFPGTEVRMWYNPDMMENRQRAIFMAGCDYLLPELVTIAVGLPVSNMEIKCEEGVVSVSADKDSYQEWLKYCFISIYDENDELMVDSEELTISSMNISGTFEMDSIKKYYLSFETKSGGVFNVL